MPTYSSGNRDGWLASTLEKRLPSRRPASRRSSTTREAGLASFSSSASRPSTMPRPAFSSASSSWLNRTMESLPPRPRCRRVANVKCAPAGSTALTYRPRSSHWRRASASSRASMTTLAIDRSGARVRTANCMKTCPDKWSKEAKDQSEEISALSPDPPGWPSLPNETISYSPLLPGERY